MTDLAQLGIQIDTNEVKKAIGDLEKLAQVGSKVDKSAADIGYQHRLLEKTFQTLDRQIRMLSGSMNSNVANSYRSSISSLEREGAKLANTAERVRRSPFFSESDPAKVIQMTRNVRELSDTLAKLQPTGKVSGFKGNSVFDSLFPTAEETASRKRELIAYRMQLQQLADFSNKAITRVVPASSRSTVDIINANTISNIGKSAQESFDVFVKKGLIAKDAIDKVSSATGGLGGRLTHAAGQAGGFGKALGGLHSQSLSLNSALLRTQGFINALISAFALKYMIQANAQFININASLKAITGSSQGAAEQLSFIRNISQDLGLNFQSTAKQYSLFLAAIEGTQFSTEDARKIFENISKSVRVLGLSTADSEGVFRALVQIMSKNQLMAEELRSQLGDRLPGSFSKMAKAVGVSTAELDKMMKAGEVTGEVLREGLLKFSEEYARSTAGGLTEATQGIAASIERLKNAFFNAATAIGQAGLNDAVLNISRSIESMISPTGEASGILKALGESARFISEHLNSFGAAIAFLVGANGISALIPLLTALAANPAFLAIAGIGTAIAFGNSWFLDEKIDSIKKLNTEAKKFQDVLKNVGEIRLGNLESISMEGMERTVKTLNEWVHNYMGFVKTYQDTNLRIPEWNELVKYLDEAKSALLQLKLNAIPGLFDKSDEQISGLKNNVQKYYDTFAPDTEEKQIEKVKKQFEGYRKELERNAAIYGKIATDYEKTLTFISDLEEKTVELAKERFKGRGDAIKDYFKNTEDTLSTALLSLVNYADGSAAAYDSIEKNTHKLSRTEQERLAILRTSIKFMKEAQTEIEKLDSANKALDTEDQDTTSRRLMKQAEQVEEVQKSLIGLKIQLESVSLKEKERAAIIELIVQGEEKLFYVENARQKGLKALREEQDKYLLGLEKQNNELEFENKILKLELESTEDARKEIALLTKERKLHSLALERDIKLLELETRLKSLRTSANPDQDAISLTEENVRKIQEMYEKLFKTVGENEDLKELRRQQQEELKGLEKAFENAAKNIQDSFADMWYNIFTGGTNSAKDFLKSLKEMFLRTISQLLALETSKFVLGPIIQGAGSLLGMPASSQQRIMNNVGISTRGNSSFGSFNLAKIFDIFGGGMSDGGPGGILGGGLLSSLTSSGGFSAFGSGLTGGIGNLVDPLFGGFSAAGPLSGIESALSGIGGLGGALGAIGGLFSIGSAFASGNVAGGVGGIAGGALGAGIGSIIPGIGTLVGFGIGSGLGSLVGGLFGGKKPKQPRATSFYGVNDQGLLYETSAENRGKGSEGLREAIRQAGGAAAQSIQEILGQIGGTLNTDLGFYVRTKNHKGLRGYSGLVHPGGGLQETYSEIGDQSVENATKAIAITFLKTVAQQGGLTTSNPDTLKAIQNSKASGIDIEGFVKDIEFGQNFQMSLQAMKDGIIDFTQAIGYQAINEVNAATASIKAFKDKTAELGLDTNAAAEATKRYVELLFGIGEPKQDISDTAKAWQTLIARFENAEAIFKEVGLDFSRIDEYLQNAKDKFIQGYNQGIQDQIKAITDPAGLAMDQLIKLQEQRLKDAQLIGADIVEIEKLHMLERQKLIEQQTGFSVQAIKDFLQQLRQSDLSPLSPAAKLTESGNAFFEALNKARQGDYNAANQLTELASPYLEAAQSYYAGNEQYVAIFNTVEDALQQFVSTVESNNGSLSGAIMQVGNAQIYELQQLRFQFQDLQASYADSQAEIAGLRQDINLLLSRTGTGSVR